MEVIVGEQGSVEQGSTFFVLGENDIPLDTFGLQLVAQFMIAKAKHDNPEREFLFREGLERDEETGEEREVYELVDVDASAARPMAVPTEQVAPHPVSPDTTSMNVPAARMAPHMPLPMAG